LEEGIPLTAILLVLSAAVWGAVDDAERAAAIGLARKALGQELGVEPRELTVQDVSAAEWADSSLGCAQKETRYLPVLTPGYRIVLEHGGRAYVMHAGAGRAVHCERGTADPGREKREAVALVARLLADARRDLAPRLGVPEDAVKPGSLLRTTWPDASLGCPQPGEVYAQVQTEGYRIELEVAGVRYHYHTDQRRAVYCREKGQP
jgi:hypothetical protein